MNLQYQYGTPGTANNGRVTQVTDLVSGEQVTYQYDSLNRLTQATAATWGQGFQYDGFGNLTGQTGTGTAPAFTGSIDANTNRRTDAGYQYDLNGNVTNMPDGTTYSYDGANRLVSNGAAYDLNNRRVWDGSQIYYYATNGQLLAKYSPQFGGASTIVRTSVNVWFGRKLIRETQPGLQAHQRWVMTDRLGSVRLNGDGERSNYYPYGQEIQGTSNGRTKFATYYRDTPGLDYADQRYYANAGGRFLTPDPGRSASPQSPGGWNRYAYTRGDPINHYDPSGMDDVNAGCAAFDDAFCDGSSLVSNDPMNTGVMAPPGMVNVFCSSLVSYFVGVSGVCTISPEQYEELVDYGPTDCTSAYTSYEIGFVTAHYADSVSLGGQAGIPSTWVLGWSAAESGWGGATSQPAVIKRHPNNFFSWEGHGDVPCPPGVSNSIGCFSSYYAAGRTALFSIDNYFNYKGLPKHAGVTAGLILLDQIHSGATAQQAFQALRNAGYAAEPNYGQRISGVVGTVSAIEDCLKSQGRLQ